MSTESSDRYYRPSHIRARKKAAALEKLGRRFYRDYDPTYCHENNSLMKLENEIGIDRQSLMLNVGRLLNMIITRSKWEGYFE